MGARLESLKAEIEEWVASLFEDFAPPRKYQRKIVRDAVHGYIILEPHEVAIIDSPPVQRLRYIHQTALAYLVYPCATHTRFEHSLGVLKAADSMARALRRADKEKVVTDTVVRELRIAGLLHDVGSVLFSHLGESILGDRFEDCFEAVKEEEAPLFESAETGEVLSYLIITSETFKRYLERVAVEYSVEFDVTRVAWYIVGQAPSDAEKYKADIINGPFDADKLDYVLRDCHFCGIKADIDVERLYHTIDIWEATDMPRYLVMRQPGIPILEQILFSKMMLYTAIYHHQKIRTLECMTRAIFEAAWAHPDAIRNKLLRFGKVTDFLRVGEFQFFAGCLEEAALKPMIRAIMNRQLLKRALMISMPSVSGDTQRKVFDLDTIKTRGYRDREILRRSIFERIPAHYQTSLSDLWVDLPKGPDINEDAVQCLVDVGETKPRELSELFPTDDWLTSYEQNKWRGHVFYVDRDDHRTKAADAAEKLLKEQYGITFLPPARQACKLPLPAR